MNFKIIAVDFDGTLCEDAYPHCGAPNLKLIEYLKQQQCFGNKIILWTCRTDETLDIAVKWCYEEHGLVFDAINDNLPGVVAIYGGSNPRKIYADIYIDDHNCTDWELPFESNKINKNHDIPEQKDVVS